jgi:DNA-binding GntR family transcriptional regulator
MAIVPTRLQEGLIERIYALIHADGMAPGERLNEKQLAERLNVSRSPIRAALDVMASRGVVVRRPHRGVELVALPPDTGAAPPAGGRSDEDLLVLIAQGRDSKALGDTVSEAELMQLYDVPRPVVRGALEKLADLGMVRRKPGYGWQFLTVWDAEIRGESYRFRLIVESAAITEPAFRLPEGWAGEMRRRHEASLSQPWTAFSSVALFEMNAAFHEGIAAGSGNRFFVEAVRRQNRLRRFANYNWRYGFERVRANNAEHMAILDPLEAGDVELAALMMRRHLDAAWNWRPSSEA